MVTVGSTSIALVAGSLVAYGIARQRLGGTPFRLFLLAMRTLPALAIVIPVYTMFRELRLLDTYWALILTSRDIQTTPVAAAGFSTNKGILWGEMAAVGVTASIPVIVFAPIVQKRLGRGLTLGAVQ